MDVDISVRFFRFYAIDEGGSGNAADVVVYGNLEWLSCTYYFLRSEKNWTLQVVIRSFNSYYAIQSDYALIMAASVIAMIPTMALFFIFQRMIIESIAISGIK